MTRSWDTPAEATHPAVNTWSDQEAAAYLGWAYASSDGVAFLAELDGRLFKRGPLFGYRPETVDIVSVRSAATNANAALDLCAAVLARLYVPRKKPKERESEPKEWAADVGWFLRWDKDGERKRQLSAEGARWLDDLEADARFQVLDELRDPMVHRRLKRTLYVSTGSVRGRTARTGFELDGDTVDAGELIRLCADLAHDHVDAFGGLVVAGVIAPRVDDADRPETP